MKSASDPSLNHISDNSLKEYFVKNINHDICHDAPLFIEDKLKLIFSNFMSELSGTMDSFPGTLLESCVSKLSATINSTIQEIICSEVIPALYEKLFKHFSEFPLASSKKEELQEFFNDRIESLQDIIIGLNDDNTSDLSCVRNSIKSLEQDMFLNLSSLKSRLAETANKEDMRFEQIKRRMSDFHTSLNSINHKLDFLVNSLQPHDPPEDIFNNPMMHEKPQPLISIGKTPVPEPRTEVPELLRQQSYTAHQIL